MDLNSPCSSPTAVSSWIDYNQSLKEPACALDLPYSFSNLMQTSSWQFLAAFKLRLGPRNLPVPSFQEPCRSALNPC